MAFRILGLLGGGAKGMFSLGVLEEVEALLGGENIARHFDLVAGTSTGAIIGALIGLGWKVPDISKLYRENVPDILGGRGASARSSRLAKMANDVFGKDKFDKFKIPTAIVTTNFTHSRPTIFKSYVGAWNGAASFRPGFDRTIAEAVTASCSAYPYFNPVIFNLQGSDQELIDGGFAANDPSLFAVLEALGQFKQPVAEIKLLTIGTGRFAKRRRAWFDGWIQRRKAVQVFESTLETTGTTQEFVIKAVYPNLQWCRIPASGGDAAIHTDLLETDLRLLGDMHACGRTAFRESEKTFRGIFC